jgi:hypothetical protein
MPVSLRKAGKRVALQGCGRLHMQTRHALQRQGEHEHAEQGKAQFIHDRQKAASKYRDPIIHRHTGLSSFHTFPAARQAIKLTGAARCSAMDPQPIPQPRRNLLAQLW